MEWLTRFSAVARQRLATLLPSFSPVETARDYISDAVAQRVKDEACAKAYEMLAQTHRSVVFTIIWQNAALLASLIPVYVLKSAVPFYGAYAAVAGYTAYTVVKSWPLVLRLAKNRSVTTTIAEEVLQGIEVELTQRQFIARKAVEWLGPDLRIIARDVARKLRPDVVAVTGNMAMTLVLAFVAFRLFAIPMLEGRALH